MMLVAKIDEQSAGLFGRGAWTLGVGLPVWFFARIGAWWHHG